MQTIATYCLCVHPTYRIVGLLSAYAYHPRLQGNNYELIINSYVYELNCEVAYCACAALITRKYLWKFHSLLFSY